MAPHVYTKIGGRKAVESVVSDFYDKVLADDQLAGYFDGYDLEELYAHQVQFISSVAGGPVTYTGADMREAHADLDLDPADFDAVAAYLETALFDNGVDEDHVEAILAAVAELEEPILGQ
ncbi:group I truncated hemoglobin [Natronosalvus halobius]|uniref:group I truncated hemoglobin n=1 Tax=Natronosalvus halobius TaxID=2953746 RepID=UPI0020A1DB4D|nr:group 1 truncated hemoglobin [Natronosalvus halobius]USZ72883.1 group 1 truncated hemoglobin [Natronosalvus halobius]